MRHWEGEGHNLAVRYAYKLDDLRETKRLVGEMIEAAENPGSRDIGRIMEEAQAEIDFLPDNQIGLCRCMTLAIGMIRYCRLR